MSYISRIIEDEIKAKLNASGAVLIRGPKACGKTETALRLASSVLLVDQDEQVPYLMDADPKRLLAGKTPRLIDEWQIQPKLWNYIRHEIDARKERSQFILTGSSTPDHKNPIHSGAGRFTSVDMRTLSWQELGYSTGQASMKHLLSDNKIVLSDRSVDLETIVERIIKGGWPGLLTSNTDEALLLNRAYIDLIAESDMSRISDIKRDPVKVRNIFRSIARNTATLVAKTTIVKDIKENDMGDISRPTVYEYLDALERLMIIESQPAWSTHIRSSASLRKSPKMHFTDVSLSVAALGADKESLLKDVRFTGFLFESLVTHDLRVYARANDASVCYYSDSSGLEVDCIVQKRNGDWAAFEIKLGMGLINEAASNLKKLTTTLDVKNIGHPKSLNIIVGTGVSHTRPDGINIISLASLGV
ncbi:MAG: ATP-binding protein [Bacteroidales bacterium]|nr:ATP-binding protein [Bacteroidales bacterium]